MKLQVLFAAAALTCSAVAVPAFADSASVPPGQSADQAPGNNGPMVVMDPAAAPASDAAAAPASDSDLAKRVKVAISSNGTLHGLPIQVAVTEGVVRLTGTVPGGVQVDQAEFVASSVPGVREVNNKLRRKHDS